MVQTLVNSSGQRTQVKVKVILSPEVSLDTGVGEGGMLGLNFFCWGMTDVSVVAKRVQRKLKEHYINLINLNTDPL